MTDWSRGYAQKFEFREVDPLTWADGRELTTVTSCTFVDDADSKIRQSATIAADGEPMRESVVRAYMTAIQDGRSERVCLGTWIAQAVRRTAMTGRPSAESTCYGCLQSVDEAMPPYGFSVPAGANCSKQAAAALSHGIAPVVASDSPKTLSRPWVADPDSTWLDVAIAMADAAGMEVSSDSWGRSVVRPRAGITAPAWTFSEGDDSVLLPNASEELDFHGIPNVVELIWTGPPVIVGRAVNDDPTSAVSVQSRGREVVMREVDPSDFASVVDQASADLIAADRLARESKASYEVEFSHGWVPAGIGSTVRVSWPSAGIEAVGTVERRESAVSTGMSSRTIIKTEASMWRMQ